MKIKKTTYNPKEEISREKLANPFSNESINERLVESDALDLTDNHTFIELNNGYIEIQVIDKTKSLKKNGG